ncbi:unnamed protein product [Sympodiomycopsis kandeliae]
MEEVPQSQPLHTPAPSGQAPQPKGILKNRTASQSEQHPSGSSSLHIDTGTTTSSGNNGGLSWDEANIALHDFEKESTQRMKIDEPKTPFVTGSGSGSGSDDGFDAFNLDNSTTGTNDEAQQLAANTSANAQLGHPSSQPSSSVSAAVGLDAADLATKQVDDGPDRRRPSFNSRNSRSPSFTLPSDSRNQVRADAMDTDGDEQAIVDAEEDEETRAQREAFAKKRNAHYGNEAEALKVAKALAAQQDDDEEDEDEGEQGKGVNGV